MFHHFARCTTKQLVVQLAAKLVVELAVQLAWDARRKTSRKAAENSLRKLRQNQGTDEPQTVVTWKSPLTRKGEDAKSPPGACLTVQLDRYN